MIDPTALLRVDLGLFFLIGLLGGVHCIGMCGPVVSMYDSARTRPDGGTPMPRPYHHGLFNLGRTVSYALLGGLFGALGGVLYLTMDSLLTITNTLRGAVGIALGALIIYHGVHTLAGRDGNALRRLPIPRLTTGRLLKGASGRIARAADGRGIVGLGLIHGLVPCPMLYAAFVYVFAIGSPINGVAALAALGIGTIPAVFLYGTTFGSIDPERIPRIHRILGGVFVLLGYVLFAHGSMAFGIHLPHPELPHYLPPELQGAGGH